MRKRVCYIHEEQTLLEALQAVLKTKHHLFIVVNSFEEYVGILTIEGVLEQIVGLPILDEFDRYEDMRAVAASIAEKEHKLLHTKEPGDE
jgi:CBS domain containing-hemolysin-like protein